MSRAGRKAVFLLLIVIEQCNDKRDHNHANADNETE